MKKQEMEMETETEMEIWNGNSSRSWYSLRDSTCLLLNCSLKAYNVHIYSVSACYQSVP